VIGVLRIFLLLTHNSRDFQEMFKKTVLSNFVLVFLLFGALAVATAQAQEPAHRTRLDHFTLGSDI
jgi:hypothetical protein